MPILNKILEKYTIKAHHLLIFFLIVLSVYISLMFFDVFNIYILSSILLLFIAYLFRKKIWLLLALSPSALLLGSFLNIPIADTWVYEANLTEVFLFLAFTVMVVDALLNSEEIKIKKDFLSFSLFLYLLLSLISFFQIIDFRLFIYGIKLIIFFNLAYVLALNYLNTKNRIRCFLYSISFLALAISSQIFYKIFKTGLSLDFFLNRNDILISLGPIASSVAVLVMILPIILAWYFQDKDKRNSFFIILIFFLGSLAVFLSLGKSAIASLFIALLYLFIKFKNKRIIFTLIFVLFVTSSFILLNSFFEGLFFRINHVFIDVSSKFRLLEIKTDINLIKNNFWTGVGSGQQIIYYSRHLFPGYKQLVNNFFLQTFIDLGVLGISTAFLIVITIWKKTKKTMKNKNQLSNPIYYGFIASMIAVLINGQVEVTLFALPYGIVFWMIMGVFSNLSSYN